MLKPQNEDLIERSLYGVDIGEQDSFGRTLQEIRSRVYLNRTLINDALGSPADLGAVRHLALLEQRQLEVVVLHGATGSH